MTREASTRGTDRVRDPDGSGHAVIVGASLSGLITGLALSREGVGVTLLERVTADPRAGAAVGVDEARLSRVTGVRPVSGRRASGTEIQAWSSVHARLRRAVDADPRIHLHHDTTVALVDQDPSAAWAVTDDGRTFRGDVVLGADGHRSVVRRTVAPEHPDATFAGYVIWLGLSAEHALPDDQAWPRDVAFLGDGDDCFLGYPLSGDRPSPIPGGRQLGWAWYDAGRNDLLRSAGCVEGSVVRRSLVAADVPDATLAELATEAERWPSPWRDAVLDCTTRHAVIGTPIAEYVPDRLVTGRLALVGDAAHVPTPMTGSGFSASVQDAESIAKLVAAGVRDHAVPAALLRYEVDRLENVRAVVRSGQRFSRSFARTA